METHASIHDGETSVEVGFGALREAAGAVLRYSGTDETAPIGPIASQNGVGAATAPAVTTTQDDTLVLRVAAADTNPGPGGDSQTPPLSGPATERFSLQSNISQLIAVTVQVAGSDAVQPIAGNTGTATWIGGGGNWVASTISIRPTGGAVSGSDLLISKTDGKAKVKPGRSLTYTIEAANLGPDDVLGATVNDMLPPALDCTWTCIGSGGFCSAGGSGDIFDNVDLPVTASVSYTVDCDVACDARGTILNTATISAPGGTTDPALGNNSATDTTQINGNADCPDAAVCGNGTIEGGEDCDLDDLGGATCTSLGLGEGDLSCFGSCMFDTSGCGAVCFGTGEVCGNNSACCSGVCRKDAPGPGAKTCQP